MKFRDTSRFELRMWGQLVDALCPMRFERDANDKGLYHFYNQDGSLFVSIRLTRQMFDGDTGGEVFTDMIVEVISPDGTSIRESFVDVRRFQDDPQHPLCDLFDLVLWPNDVVTPKALSLHAFLGSLNLTAR